MYHSTLWVSQPVYHSTLSVSQPVYHSTLSVSHPMYHSSLSVSQPMYHSTISIHQVITHSAKQKTSRPKSVYRSVNNSPPSVMRSTTRSAMGTSTRSAVRPRSRAFFRDGAGVWRPVLSFFWVLIRFRPLTALVLVLFLSTFLLGWAAAPFEAEPDQQRDCDGNHNDDGDCDNGDENFPTELCW